jgi:hypothetical protein
MSDDDKDRLRRLETTLTGGIQNLLSNPNETSMAPLAARLARENIHVTQVKVYIGAAPLDPDAALQKRIDDLNYVIELGKRAHHYVPWKDFVFACSTKIDVSIGSKWMPVIAQAIGEHIWTMQFYQRSDTVPIEWLEKVYKLPDWTPPAEFKRNNFAEIAVELVAALKSVGKSNLWIANTLTAFLRDFNGTKVERGDVTMTPPPPTKT